jgi:CIC family chloride channel protein
MTVSEARKAFPLGSTKQIFAVEDGRLVGVIDLAELHGPDLNDGEDRVSIASLIHDHPPFLQLSDDVRSALAKFTEAQVETLAVVDELGKMHVVGYLTEAYVLRRYTRELERGRGSSDGTPPLSAKAFVGGPDSDP